MPEFLVAFPVWLIVPEGTLVQDDRGHPIGFSQNLGFHGTKDAAKTRLTVLTDEDLADRFLASNPHRRWTKLSLDRPRFVELLRALADEGFTHVTFDPVPAGTIYSIESVVASLE
jgi:hypothetical protein